jgi:hypothetical protein
MLRMLIFYTNLHIFFPGRPVEKLWHGHVRQPMPNPVHAERHGVLSGINFIKLRHFGGKRFQTKFHRLILDKVPSKKYIHMYIGT